VQRQSVYARLVTRRRQLGRSRGIRARVLSGLCASLCALGATFAAAASLGASRPRCPTAQLRVTVLDVQGATSHRYWDLALRNIGHSSCRLQGFPGVGLLDKAGRPIAVTVARQTGFPTPAVTVAAGRHAYFTFGYTTGGPCKPHDFNAYGLEIYPPDDYKRLLVTIAGGINLCDTSLGGAPVVYPVRATSSLG
jgi:hypothetical protein